MAVLVATVVAVASGKSSVGSTEVLAESCSTRLLRCLLEDDCFLEDLPTTGTRPPFFVMLAHLVMVNVGCGGMADRGCFV